MNDVINLSLLGEQKFENLYYLGYVFAGFVFIFFVLAILIAAHTDYGSISTVFTVLAIISVIAWGVILFIPNNHKVNIYISNNNEVKIYNEKNDSINVFQLEEVKVYDADDILIIMSNNNNDEAQYYKLSSDSEVERAKEFLNQFIADNEVEKIKE